LAALLRVASRFVLVGVQLVSSHFT